MAILLGAEHTVGVPAQLILIWYLVRIIKISGVRHWTEADWNSLKIYYNLTVIGIDLNTV